MFRIFASVMSVAQAAFDSDKRSKVTVVNNDNWKDILSEFRTNPKDVKPILIAMISGECTAGTCVKFTKELRQASSKLQKHRIAVVDCEGAIDACRGIP